MHSDKRSFTDFLVQTSPFPDRIPDVMQHINPFLRFSDEKSYPLANASHLRKTKVIRTIASVTQKPVSDIMYVSRSTPYDRPDWMTKKSYRQSVVQSLKESLGMGIRETLIQGLGAYIRNNDAWDNVRADVSSHLESDIIVSLADGMNELSEDPLATEMEKIIEACLLHLIALTLYCDPSQSDRVKDLIMLLKQALPLGEWIEDSTTWLVLTA